MLKRLLKNSHGNVAVIFGLAALPLVVATGGAIDYSVAYDQRTTVQDALDTGALAAGRKLGLLTTSQLKAEAQAFYASNIGTKLTNVPVMNVAVTGATLTATTQLKVPTNFLGIIGLDQIIFDLSSSVTSGIGTLEVAMVLDNSGSMAGTKIATLITAATDLTTTLYALGTASTKPDPVKISLVPFATAVNVGSANKTAAWMDTTGVSPYHGENFEPATGSPPVSTNTPPVNVFTLFNAMNGAANAWKGCVEERKAPYDVNDDAATTGTPATMFVPMFAPDEPDNWTCTTSLCSSSTQKQGSGSTLRYNAAPTGTRSFNNYLPDFAFGGTGKCATANDNNKWTCASGNANCNGINKGVNEATALARYCKYGTPSNKVTPVSLSVNYSGGTYAGGPNFMCTTKEITPLTPNKSTVTTGINVMAALGTTNITAGLIWGWRVLSPTAPFTDGRSYSDAENQKILILMTDGDNTYFPNGKSLTGTHYGAWSYIVKGHLGTTSTSTNTIVGKMNDRVATACANIKAAGVKIYTVAFQVDDGDTLAMLETCASSTEMAFQSSSSTALLEAFTAIGDDISSLRVSK